MSDKCTVAVVGAGLSGLTAAYRLRGHDPVVLEADVQIGGRSQRTELAGWPITSGGEGWYDPNPESPESRFLSEVGIDCMPVKGPAMLHANGDKLSLTPPATLANDLGLPAEAHPDFVATFERVRDTCEALVESPVREGLIETLLATPAVEWLGQVHPDVLEFYRRLTATELGTYLETASAFMLLYGMPLFGGASDVWMNFLVPEGGAPMISVALADALPREPITGAMVTAISQDDGQATISYREAGNERTLTADYVIVATPPPVTTEIVRGMPSEKLRGMSKIAVGPIVEVSLLLADGGPAPWDEMSAMWTVDKTFSVCLHSKTDHDNRFGDGGGTKHSVIKMIAVGTNAGPLADRSDEAVAAAFIKDFVDMFPEAAGKAEAHAVKRWMHGVQVPTLGFEDHVPELLQPVGRVHFAGDWCGFVSPETPGGFGTDGDWGAYGVTVGLNSAVRAGMRAASEVAERMAAR